MPSSFGQEYFSHQYILDVGQEVNLFDVYEGATYTVELHNAASGDITAPITFPLEDYSFGILWEGRTGQLTSAAFLAGEPVTVAGFGSKLVTITFLAAARESLQAVDFGWAGASLSIEFNRERRVTHAPQAGMIEEWVFKTNVSESWDGTEQRTRLRANPRGTLSQSYLVGNDDRASGRDFAADAVGMGMRKAGLPIWHAAQPATYHYVSGVTPAPFAYYVFDLIEGTRWDPAILSATINSVLLIQGADGVFHDVPVIVPPDGTRIIMDGTINPNFTANETVVIFPKVTALLLESPKIKNYPSGAALLESKWTYDQPEFPGNELDTSSYADLLAPDQFDGRNILREGNFVTGSQTLTGNSGAIKFDHKIGSVDTFHRRESSAVTFGREFRYDNDRVSVDNLRSFLLWTQGRQRSFYVSSESADLAPDTIDDGNLFMIVDGVGFGNLVPLVDGYTAFEISWDAGPYVGSTSQHPITSTVALTNGQTRIHYTTSIGTNDTADIRVSLLYHVRLASDTIKVKYEGRDTASCDLKVVSVKQ
tara:strand:- start:1001 stop:2611 length:1611 start_codon:yes stop_codon:yes gene_type:complete